MPVAKPPLPPMTPAALSDEEVSFIKETVCKFYGDAATIRNFGPDQNHIQLHVEADRDSAHERWDCLGILMTRIERSTSLTVTTRGSKVVREAKLAYRQGVVL